MTPDFVPSKIYIHFDHSPHFFIVEPQITLLNTQIKSFKIVNLFEKITKLFSIEPQHTIMNTYSMSSEIVIPFEPFTKFFTEKKHTRDEL